MSIQNIIENIDRNASLAVAATFPIALILAAVAAL